MNPLALVGSGGLPAFLPLAADSADPTGLQINFFWVIVSSLNFVVSFLDGLNAASGCLRFRFSMPRSQMALNSIRLLSSASLKRLGRLLYAFHRWYHSNCSAVIRSRETLCKMCAKKDSAGLKFCSRVPQM